MCALLAVLRQRPLLAGVLLGLGVAAKLYPVVIIAAVAVFYLAHADWRAALRLACGSIVAGAVIMVPFLLLAPGQMLSFVTYHEQRGLQLESVAGGLAALSGALHLTNEQLAFNFGAMHLQSAFASAVLGWLLPLFAGALLLVLWLWFRQFWREFQETGYVRFERLVACVVSVLLVFMVTNKVLSPQYMIWLLPFVPLLGVRQQAAFAVLLACTITLFPFWYAQLQAFDVLPVLLLNVRNLLLIMFIPWLLLDGRFVTAARPAHSCVKPSGAA
jgi:uncharacterized membrane protein